MSLGAYCKMPPTTAAPRKEEELPFDPLKILDFPDTETCSTCNTVTEGLDEYFNCGSSDKDDDSCEDDNDNPKESCSPTFQNMSSATTTSTILGSSQDRVLSWIDEQPEVKSPTVIAKKSPVVEKFTPELWVMVFCFIPCVKQIEENILLPILQALCRVVRNPSQPLPSMRDFLCNFLNSLEAPPEERPSSAPLPFCLTLDEPIPKPPPQNQSHLVHALRGRLIASPLFLSRLRRLDKFEYVLVPKKCKPFIIGQHIGYFLDDFIARVDGAEDDDDERTSPGVQKEEPEMHTLCDGTIVWKLENRFFRGDSFEEINPPPDQLGSTTTTTASHQATESSDVVTLSSRCLSQSRDPLPIRKLKLVHYLNLLDSLFVVLQTDDPSRKHIKERSDLFAGFRSVFESEEKGASLMKLLNTFDRNFSEEKRVVRVSSNSTMEGVFSIVYSNVE